MITATEKTVAQVNNVIGWKTTKNFSIVQLVQLFAALYQTPTLSNRIWGFVNAKRTLSRKSYIPYPASLRSVVSRYFSHILQYEEDSRKTCNNPVSEFKCNNNSTTNKYHDWQLREVISQTQSCKTHFRTFYLWLEVKFKKKTRFQIYVNRQN